MTKLELMRKEGSFQSKCYHPFSRKQKGSIGIAYLCSEKNIFFQSGLVRNRLFFAWGGGGLMGFRDGRGGGYIEHYNP